MSNHGRISSSLASQAIRKYHFCATVAPLCLKRFQLQQSNRVAVFKLSTRYFYTNSEVMHLNAQMRRHTELYIYYPEVMVFRTVLDCRFANKVKRGGSFNVTSLRQLFRPAIIIDGLPIGNTATVLFRFVCAHAVGKKKRK